MDRKVLNSNVSHKNVNTSTNMKMVVDYNIQYKKFEKNHPERPILKQDRVLGSFLPERPQFIYRKAPTLRDRLAPGVIDPPTQVENRLASMHVGDA